MAAAQCRHHAPVGSHQRERRKLLALLLEGALGLADGRGQRAGRGLRVHVHVIQAAGVAQAGEEGEEDRFSGRIALHRTAQIVG